MEVPQLKADYIEKIAIQPEDIIPKSSWFKCVKYLLVTILILMTIIAIIAIIVAESFLEQSYLAVGVISLVGIILFLIGIIATVKEHVPTILIFAVSMIFYLLVIMYSRIFDSAGMIITRTTVLSLIIIGEIAFCIMIRDWRQIQVSRLKQRAIKEAQYQYAVRQQYQQRSNLNSPFNHQYVNSHIYEQIENRPYRPDMTPGPSGIILTTSHYH